MDSEYKLPPFVQIYSIPSEYTIVAKSNQFYIKEENYKPFPTFEAADDYITKELQGRTVFNAEEITQNSEGLSSMGPGMLNIWDGTHYRMFMSYSKEESIKFLEDTYQNFLNDTVPEYIKNPTDFLNSWHFLNTHPMTWSHKPPMMEYWSTDVGLDELTISLCEDAAHHPRPKILLEYGPYESDTIDGIKYEHVIHTLDFDLTSEGDTFEEAIIILASKVMKHYTVDGEKII
jgi:hypothetical protein